MQACNISKQDVLQYLKKTNAQATWHGKYGIISNISKTNITYQYVHHGHFRLHVWKEKVEYQFM
jgi:hypothetical protein